MWGKKVLSLPKEEYYTTVFTTKPCFEVSHLGLNTVAVRYCQETCSSAERIIFPCVVSSEYIQ